MLLRPFLFTLPLPVQAGQTADLLADVMPAAAYAAVENGCLTVELAPNSGTVLKLNG